MERKQRASVILIINALHSGGAETTCIELVRELRNAYDVHVLALLGGGPAECELRALDVKVLVPSPRSGAWGRLCHVWYLVTLLRRIRPVAVITFLYVADFVGGSLTRMLLPRTAVYWNVRCNVLPRDRVSAVSRWCARVNALISPFVPSGIVYCSGLSRHQHERLGFRGRRSFVVENSPAAVRFAFDVQKRKTYRRSSGVDEFVFLFVGRFDPVKRVDTFIDACARVQRAHPGRVRFLIAGQGMDAGNAQLRFLLEGAGIGECCQLLGYVSDPQALYSAADCLVVTSESEGSPNVIYEAMATRLHTLILATLGTETMSGQRVQRLATRSINDLTDAMKRLVAAGVPQDATRLPVDGGMAPVEHPLVSFYKGVLAR